VSMTFLSGRLTTICAITASAGGPVATAQIVDYNDPTYGTQTRELRKDDGHEHNLYCYRDVRNADGSRMLGIQSDLEQHNRHVCLYDGSGVAPWDRQAPDRPSREQ
jgi:hypothetical protein